MKSYVIALVLLLSGIALQAQKVINDPNAQVRTVSSFHGIHVSHSIELVVTQGSEEGLAVSASDKEDVEGIRTVVDNGILKISYDQKNKMWPRNRRLKAYVSARTIDELRATGASKVKVDGELRTTSLKLSLSGASKIDVGVQVSGKMDVNLSGASDVTIRGGAQEVSIDASGASDVKAYDFKATVCSVEASGASSVHVSVDKELSAKLSGASSLSYKGSATIRDIRTSGASSISRKS